MLISILCFAQGCAVFKSPLLPQGYEFGDALTHRLNFKEALVKSDIDEIIPQARAFAKINTLAKKNISALNILLKSYAKEKNLISILNKLKSDDESANTINLALVLALFPIQRNHILGVLSRAEKPLHIEIYPALLAANINAKRLIKRVSLDKLEDILTPLINSLSINLYKFSEQAKNKMWFKPSHSNTWQAAFALHYVPTSGALSGSIVHLQANMSYDIKVEVTDRGELYERLYSAKTRPNSPPIDPQKIIYLKDIYEGGALDLSAFDINGSKDGWTKIIGDDVVIDAGNDADASLFLGNAEYVMLENITIKGGKRFGIHSVKAHHIWIDGCNVSEFGRKANDYRGGKGYEIADSAKPINYDAGIFLRQTGVVVIENCEVHSPNHSANHWGNGHPNGSSAMLVSAKHPKAEYSGQYIVRHNRFFGTKKVRFNDVIESRSNIRHHGGFLRDSAIHDNYLAFANDDVIELDGGQSNVLIYNNTITQGYCGISLAPNMIGPSYVFNNDISDLGDERGSEWAAFKMGGLFSAPSGKTFIFQNYVDVKANGIAAGGIRGDLTFWAETRNNIFRLSSFRDQKRGYGIRDTQSYYRNRYKGDLILNLVTRKHEAITRLNNENVSPYAASDNESAQLTANSLQRLKVKDNNRINNFSYPTELSSSLRDKVSENTTDILSDEKARNVVKLLNKDYIAIGVLELPYED
ncbi:MAG: hypothetical protein ACI97K_002332 [Glaciecola sp.]|jgi:hypothetical protein